MARTKGSPVALSGLLAVEFTAVSNAAAPWPSRESSASVPVAPPPLLAAVVSPPAAAAVVSAAAAVVALAPAVVSDELPLSLPQAAATSTRPSSTPTRFDFLGVWWFTVGRSPFDPRPLPPGSSGARSCSAGPRRPPSAAAPFEHGTEWLSSIFRRGRGRRCSCRWTSTRTIRSPTPSQPWPGAIRSGTTATTCAAATTAGRCASPPTSGSTRTTTCSTASSACATRVASTTCGCRGACGRRWTTSVPDPSGWTSSSRCGPCASSSSRTTTASPST